VAGRADLIVESGEVVRKTSCELAVHWPLEFTLLRAYGKHLITVWHLA
jgi:hypothetical protein